MTDAVGHKRSGSELSADEDGGRRRSTRPAKAAKAATSAKKDAAGAAPPAEKLPVIRYREGEPLTDLVAAVTAAEDGGGDGLRFEVRVPADAATSQNRQVRARQLWGTDEYTHDSDIVAVLMHQGYYSHALAAPPAGVAEVRAVVTALPPRDRYAGSSRNCVRSRGWATKAEGCAYRVERASIVLRGGGAAPLARAPPGAPPALPTFRPTATSRAVSTRATAAAGDRRARGAVEVALQYSLAGEPWLKYSAAAAADRGLARSAWTSARLESAVLLLETHTTRYELSRVPGPPAADGAGDAYRWARVTRPLPLRRMRALGLPLPAGELDVIHAALPWEALAWGRAGVAVAGTEVPIVRLHFVDACEPGGGATSSEEEEDE